MILAAGSWLILDYRLGRVRAGKKIPRPELFEAPGAEFFGKSGSYSAARRAKAAIARASSRRVSALFGRKVPPSEVSNPRSSATAT